LANITSHRIPMSDGKAVADDDKTQEARNKNNSDKELSSSLWNSFLSFLAFEFVVNPPSCEEETSLSLV
jgi:hypothetical protein